MTGIPALRGDRVETVGLGSLFAFTAVALAGYATFGRHPELLSRVPQVAGFYAVAFGFFARAQVWLAWCILGLVLTRRVGARWVPAFATLYLLSLASELLGTTVGLPFGEYRYTEALGPKWFGHVPIVIPLSWFFMAVPSYALAGPARPLRRVLVASLVLLSWDLALDPAMSAATAYWVWAGEGVYYGMPWLNLLGWYITGMALMAALELLRADRWLGTVPRRWLGGFYGANLVLPLGMCLAADYIAAVVATFAALASAAMVATVAAPRGKVAVQRTPEAAG